MVQPETERTIEALLEERRTFDPPENFVEHANANDPSLYVQAERDPDSWWESQAERLDWFERWDQVLEWTPPYHRWFVGGKLNVAHNCLDRHLSNAGDRVAYHWVGEPGDNRTITYRELHEEVCGLANALTELGIEKGDRIYLPMIPELPAAMLACARIGAPHSVVFGGFAAAALRDRINDAEAKVLDDRRTRSRLSGSRRGLGVGMSRRWIRRTFSTSFTPRERRGSRRGSCTRRAGIHYMDEASTRTGSPSSTTGKSAPHGSTDRGPG